MPVFELLKWIGFAGIAHAILTIVGNTGGGEAAFIAAPLLQVAAAVSVFWAARSGEAFQRTKDKTMAAALLLAVLPLGFLWSPGVLAVFIPACVIALWIAPPAQRETRVDLSFAGQVCSLTSALFAASTIPGMVGNQWSEDSTSLLKVLAVLAFFVLASAAFLFTRSDIQRIRSRIAAGRFGTR